MEKLSNQQHEEQKKRAFQFIQTVIDYDEAPTENIADLKAWKLNNQISVVLKAIAYFNTMQIQPNKLRIKEISKFIEYCSFENEESMQFKWAALLANALNPYNENISLLVFMELLNQLSDEEINILELLYERSFQESSEQKAELSKLFIAKHSEIRPDFVELLLDNLKRLQLIEKMKHQKSTSTLSDPYFGKQEIKTKEETYITLSSLGLHFIKTIIFEL